MELFKVIMLAFNCIFVVKSSLETSRYFIKTTYGFLYLDSFERKNKDFHEFLFYFSTLIFFVSNAIIIASSLGWI